MDHSSVEEMRRLVIRAGAADGDPADRLAAFGELVERFQDMVYAYAYAILGDFHLAEDAAQDAFVTTFEQLGKLRDPAAFPCWLRRIVRTACSRLTRRKELEMISLAAAAGAASKADDPARAVEKSEVQDAVMRAIRDLSDPQREVTTLFYINGYSHKDIADFLEVPVTTIKNRLHASRKRLKERMMAMVADELKDHRPSREFVGRIRRVIELRKGGQEEQAHRTYDEMLRSLRALQEAGKFKQVVEAHERIVETVKAEGTYGPEMWWDSYRELAHSYLASGEPRKLATGLLDGLPDEPPRGKGAAFAGHVLVAARAFLAAGRLEQADEQILRVLEAAGTLKGRPDSCWCRIQGLGELRRIAEKREDRQRADELLGEIHQALSVCEQDLANACPGLRNMAEATTDEQRQWFRRVGDAYHNLAVECAWHWQEGRDKVEALRLMRRATELRDFAPSEVFAARLILSVEGDRSAALSHLRRVAGCPEWRGLLRKEFRECPEFEELRKDPEFLAVVSG